MKASAVAFFCLALLAAPLAVEAQPVAPLRTIGVMVSRPAADRGRLRAQRDARGQWRSTRPWVDEYRARRYQRSHD
jgi:hypothetical protein